MSFNEDELKKIEKSTSGMFKKSARKAIAQAITRMRPKIDEAKKLSDEQRRTALKELVKEATASRHRALASGAKSYGNAEWAAAATCESWLHELINGDLEGIARVESLIARLQQR